jgi:hypothetical protein
MPFIVATYVSDCSPRAAHALRSDQFWACMAVSLLFRQQVFYSLIFFCRNVSQSGWFRFGILFIGLKACCLNIKFRVGTVRVMFDIRVCVNFSGGCLYVIHLFIQPVIWTASLLLGFFVINIVKFFKLKRRK